jgi:uncharacterized protein with ParB-like and HNH nuclease domain
MSTARLIKKPITFRTMGKILSGSEEAPMEIPDYQRTYSWGSDEIDDFISDLLELKKLRDDGERRTHFLGGIVAYEEETEVNFPQKIHYIVDGQQRLVTLQIALALIWQEYEELLKRFTRLSNTEYEKRTIKKIETIKSFFEYSFTDTLGDEHSVPILTASSIDHPVLEKVFRNEDKPQDGYKQ